MRTALAVISALVAISALVFATQTYTEAQERMAGCYETGTYTLD